MAGESAQDLRDERAFLAAPADPAIDTAADALPDTARHRRPAPLLVLRRLLDAVRAACLAEWERGTAFLFLPVFLAMGSVAYFEWTTEPAFLPLAVTAAVLAVAVYAARRHVVAHLMLLAALLVAMGLLAGKLESWRMGTRMLGSEIGTRITGRIVAIEERPDGRARLTIDLVSTERPTLRYAPGRIRVTARRLPVGAGPGSGVSGTVRLLPVYGPVRPGSYDFSYRSYFDGIGASGFFLSGPEPATLAAPVPLRARLAAGIERWRMALAGHIRTYVPGPEGEIAAALFAGVQSGIPENVNEALRVTGLAHVLSISGLHMALVAGTVMVLLRSLLALFPGFASRHPIRKYAAGAALAAISLYLLVSGAGVATQRSYVMLAVMLVALFFDRAAITMRNFAIAAVVVIAIAPHEIVGPSFQMSFAATAALIAGYAAWGEWRGRRVGRPPPPAVSRPRQALATALRYAGGLAMTSLVAGTATALYAAWHFQRVSSLGLVANLATMPIVSFIVMPAMVLGAVLMPFGLDGPAFTLMGKGIALFLVIATELARHSPFDAVGIVSAAAVAFLTAALVILTLATTWLRLAAVPFALAGAALVILRPLPDLFISEDAQLVALRLSGDAVAVNRKRPNTFTMQEWSRAMMAEATVPPAAAAMPVLPENAAEAPFSCSADLCVARHRSGAVIVHSRNAADAAAFCKRASLIVIDDATARNPCAGTATTVLTKRDLARRGAASVTFGKLDGKGSGLHLDYAVSRPYRPWHAQRAFSREARGLAPYRNARQERKRHGTESPKRQNGAAQQDKERGQGSKRTQETSQYRDSIRQHLKE